MIPLLYRLREEIRFEWQENSCVVISETPLNVVRVRERAVEVLRLCDGSRTLAQIALVTAMTEEQVFRLCEYFNKKAILEIAPVTGGDYFPSVTVIIPTKDRRDELAECLESVFSQDYLNGSVEVIVVDDGSKDGTRALVNSFNCKLLSHEISRGQSYCRNIGAREARGEILAFLDSDCVAGLTWLKEIVAYFRWTRIGAVGGYVDGYFDNSSLDRYEQAFSPLNMGSHILYGTDDNSNIYTPTCNLLVRRKAYMQTGGIREDMHVGEDVDFCWRMRAKGYDTLYVPVGAVKHKHRNELGKMLKRRRDYGTSEATLYTLHPEKKKTFQIPLLATVSFFSLCAAILLLSMLPLFVAGACFLFEVWMKVSKLARMSLCIPLRRICFSVARNFFSFSYFASFHVVRYYLVALFLLGFAAYHVWLLSLFVLLVASMVDYHLKKPQLNFLQFLFYYVLDHMAYQMGVIAGCIHKRTLGSYVPRFVRRTAVTLL